MKISVLAYHAGNITSNKYHLNDHIALEQDLLCFQKNDVKILSTHDLINWLCGDKTLSLNECYVVLTFDDGSELDFTDWQHPTCGFQKSFYSLLQNYPDYIHATSFVIASPDARKTLEQTCLGGYEMWGDEWWQEAEDSGLLSIENHSWDHVHSTLGTVKQKNNLKGDFKKINSLSDANAQILDASSYIESQIKKKIVSSFAYPYGDYNSYLTDEYLPKGNIQAAFTCEPKPVTQSTNPFKIPRYVCGHDWKTSKELLNKILSAG